MIQELLARAAEDLTVALNNFETAHKELTDDELAAFKEVCRKAKEAVLEALEAAKGDLDAKTAETIRKIETLIQQGLTSIDEKVAQAGTDITGKVDKAKQDVDTKVRQGLTSIDEKVAQGVAAVGTKEQEAKNTLNKKTNEAKQYIDNQLSAASAGIDTKIRTNIQTHMAGEEAKLLEKVNQKFIQLFTSIYTVQFPGMPSPGSIFSFSGYRWSKVYYNGCFFRAEGTNALLFNDREQDDAIRNIKGGFGTQGSDAYPGSNTGAFFAKALGHVDGGTSSRSNYNNLVYFDTSRVVPTANENRPRNRTIVIWKLEKV